MCDNLKNSNVEELKKIYSKRLEETSQQRQDLLRKVEELTGVIHQLTGAMFALDQILAMEPKPVEEKKEE